MTRLTLPRSEIRDGCAEVIRLKHCKKLLCPVSNLAFADLEGIRTNHVLIIPWELHIEVAQDYDAIVEAART